jgi:GT2 family glycosyltransferase
MVDNGGSTPSVGKYSGQTNIKVLHFPENLGFADGNNKALEHAEGDIILLMNQDVVVHFNCLEELISAFEYYPQAGVISANMLMVSSKNHLDRYGSIHKTVGLYKLTSFGYALYSTQKTEQEMIPVEFVSGNAMGFRKSMLNDLGQYLFDQRLINYAEDLDLSIRLKKTRWQMYVRSKAVVYHYRGNAFTGKPTDRLRKLAHVSSNRLLVYYNNFSFGKFVLKLPALILGIPLKVARPDGSKNFYLLNFLVALILVPLIFAYFCMRAFYISVAESRKPDITSRISENSKICRCQNQNGKDC